VNLLLARLPALAARLPLLRLGTYPTPIQRLASLERALDLPPGTELWVKRDDLSGEPWGTSKVRKLENYFAEARATGARRVATVGPFGSNHALATAIYAHALGIEALLQLWPEPMTPKVLETLRVEHALGARLQVLGGVGEEALAALAEATPPDSETIFIPPAGTDAVGATGYVECGLEIMAADAGFDFVHTAGGTGGVAAGLALGLSLAASGAGARVPVVVAVRAVAKEILSTARLLLLSKRIAERLRALGAGDDPALTTPPGRERFRILDAFAGAGYGRPTDDGARAARLFQEREGLTLDPVYTAKAAAGFLDFARSLEGAGRRHVFLHTYGSRDLSAIAARARLEDLPAAFQPYLEGMEGPTRNAAGDKPPPYTSPR